MPTPEVEAFAKAIVQLVRDRSIRSCDVNLRPDAKNIVAERWRAAGGEAHSMARTIIPDIVDNTVFHLLDAIDNGLLRLVFTDSSGRVVDLMKNGLSEMAGWYMGTGGWRAQYSQERFIDDCADLRLE